VRTSRTEMGVSRETWIGIVALGVSIAVMATDHLVGSDPGLEDPPAFLIGAGVSLILAIVVFGIVVPRAKRDGPERSAGAGLVCGVIAVLSVAVAWLVPPFVLAGAAIALGVLGRSGQRKRRATVAIALGTLAAVLGLLVADTGADED
jgi:hypothetical protein